MFCRVFGGKFKGALLRFLIKWFDVNCPVPGTVRIVQRWWEEGFSASKSSPTEFYYTKWSGMCFRLHLMLFCHSFEGKIST